MVAVPEVAGRVNSGAETNVTAKDCETLTAAYINRVASGISRINRNRIHPAGDKAIVLSCARIGDHRRRPPRNSKWRSSSRPSGRLQISVPAVPAIGFLADEREVEVLPLHN